MEKEENTTTCNRSSTRNNGGVCGLFDVRGARTAYKSTMSTYRADKCTVLANKRSAAFGLEEGFEAGSRDYLGQKIVCFLHTICADDVGRKVRWALEKSENRVQSQRLASGTLDVGQSLCETQSTATKK